MIPVEVVLTGSVQLPFFDHRYKSFWIAPNGYISFGKGMTGWTTTPFPYPDDIMLSAFWSDIHLKPCYFDGNNVYYRQETDPSGSLLTNIANQIRQSLPQYRNYQPKWAAVVTFDRVVARGAACINGIENAPRNTFQILLTTDGTRTFGIFNYEKLEWILHNDIYYASGGFNAGDNITFHELEGSRTENFGQVVSRSNVEEPGRWMFRVDKRQIEDTSCTQIGIDEVQATSAPRYGSIFGGNEVLISGVCADPNFPENEAISCQFGKTKVVGDRQHESIVRCIAPPLAGNGPTSLRVSVDGGRSYPHILTYSYDATANDIQLIQRKDWPNHFGGSKISITWDPLILDPAVDELTSTVSQIDVDLILWYISGADPANGIRSASIALATGVPNTGQLEFLTSQINITRGRAKADQPVFLAGTFRIVKTDDRNAFYTAESGWIGPAVKIWSKLTDVDVFSNLNDPLARQSSQERFSPSLGLQLELKTNVFDNATSRPASVLSREQWDLYYATRPSRRQMVSEILRCLKSPAVTSFCDCWAERERAIIPYNSDDNSTFLACPPNINQVRLDRGRFNPESSLTSAATCNRNTRPIGNVFWDVGECDEHPGAVLCVNALTANQAELAQQCCYNEAGTLTDAETSPSGGRVRFIVQDRSDLRDVEPGDLWLAQRLEEQLIDRKPQEMCCPRKGNWDRKDCQLFRRIRRGGSAKHYLPPSAPGGGFGDPHIWTLDGFRYTFNGLGEYVLVEMPGQVVIQGRTAQATGLGGRNNTAATVWSGLAFNSSKSIVQISLSTRGGLDLYLNWAKQELMELTNSIEFNDIVIYLTRNGTEPVHRISAQSSTGITVDVEEVDSVLEFQITLPSELKGNITHGLLGNWNGKTQDDLLPRTSLTSLNPDTASPQDIFNDFGETWRIEKAESLFTYQAPSQTYELINDLKFRPQFTEPSMAPNLQAEANIACAGNAECRFDVAITGNLGMGKNSAIFVKDMEDAIQVGANSGVSCGFPNIREGSHSRLVQGTSFGVGDTLTFECFHEDKISTIPKRGDKVMRCGENGVWTGSPLECVVSCSRPLLTSSLVALRGNATTWEVGNQVVFYCTNSTVPISGNIKDRTAVCTDRGEWFGGGLECGLKRQTTTANTTATSATATTTSMAYRMGEAANDQYDIWGDSSIEGATMPAIVLFWSPPIV
ncbi:putative Sushi domain-containing protein 2 [Hypsibius exemplaris]|uniref:Sushi domain-containing protein 2 n=1 Tax=Hypsibius exemplaris TaxID=2072580 RepID=A0A1W0XC01_HYPEX|nr:putative Sushi domain-containing protein 2 [Hypsibius exemplaris]